MFFPSKKVVISVLIFFFLLLGTMKNISTATISSDLLEQAMEATGAQVEEVSLNAWMKLPNVPYSDEQIERLVQQTMAELGILPQHYQLTQTENNQQYYIQGEAGASGFRTRVIGKRIQQAKTEIPVGTYLIITMEGKTNENLDIFALQKAIWQISKKNDSTPHISTCLIGWLNGTLRDGEQQDLLQQAFKVIDGRIIDKLEAERFSSYTGFVSGLMEGLQVGDQQVNLNMAMRYSQYDDRTYVTIGSPIITREY